jgi:hypothetical protein
MLDGDADEIADLDFDFAADRSGILRRSMIAFGLQSGVDDHEILVDADNFCGDHFTCAHFLARRLSSKRSAKLSCMVGADI